jgi:hypothetical protein
VSLEDHIHWMSKPAFLESIFKNGPVCCFGILKPPKMRFFTLLLGQLEGSLWILKAKLSIWMPKGSERPRRYGARLRA